jgi:hypothetical protein
MSEECQIYIRGFSRSTREDDLKKSFGDFGEIKECRIVSAYAFIVGGNLCRHLRNQRMQRQLLRRCMTVISMGQI